MRKFLFILLLAVGCGKSKQDLIDDGYQVFSEYHLAIKTPCVLSIDSTAQLDSSLKQNIVMVCPQIFKDTTRSSFDIVQLLASNNTIYHLQFYPNKPYLSTDSLLALEKKILNHLGIQKIKETNVDGKQALAYRMDRYTSAVYVPGDFYSYFIAVSADSSEEKLNRILNDVRSGEFE